MKKRGISAVIATIILILFTITSIFIIWQVIVPLVEDSLQGAKPQKCLELQGSLNINKNKAYTFYNQTHINIGIERQGNTPGIIALELIIDVEGSTISKKQIKEIPTELGLEIYTFKLTDLGYNNQLKEEDQITISISPVILNKEDEEISCEPSRPQEINYKD